MRVITFSDIASLGISPATCVAWVEEDLRMKERSILPPKTSLKPHGMENVFYNTMPCIVPEIEGGGVKEVTRYLGRTPSIDSEILLYDLNTGAPAALMDGDWITTWRTGAVAVHSVCLLAKKGFSRVGIMGLGNTARATMACLAASMPDRSLEVGLLRYKSQAQEFEERFTGLRNVTFHTVDSVEELAKESEVFVSCVTAADGECLSPDAFPPGVLVVPVHTRGFAGCDLAFDKVYCDDEGHVKGFRYYVQFKDKLAEVADVVCGRKPGRESDDERIIAYNIGISLHDIAFASRIYKLLGENACEIDLEKPKEKFWA